MGVVVVNCVLVLRMRVRPVVVWRVFVSCRMRVGFLMAVVPMMGVVGVVTVVQVVCVMPMVRVMRMVIVMPVRCVRVRMMTMMTMMSVPPPLCTGMGTSTGTDLDIFSIVKKVGFCDRFWDGHNGLFNLQLRFLASRTLRGYTTQCQDHVVDMFIELLTWCFPIAVDDNTGD